MSLFDGPETHAANPPETWKVERFAPHGGRATFYLTTADGGRLSSAYVRRCDAESARSEGFYFNLWHSEARWYAGETPAGHRSWEECKAERERTRAYNVVRKLMRCIIPIDPPRAERNLTLADSGSA